MGIDEIAEHRASWRLSSTEMADTVESWLAGQSWLGLEMSSGRCSRGGDRAPDGWRERALLVRFLAPGMCTIRKRYLRVFFLQVPESRIWYVLEAAIPKDFQ